MQQQWHLSSSRPQTLQNDTISKRDLIIEDLINHNPFL